MRVEVLVYFTCDNGTTMHTKQKPEQCHVSQVIAECQQAVDLLFAGEVTKVEVYHPEKGLIQTYEGNYPEFFLG